MRIISEVVLVVCSVPRRKKTTLCGKWTRYIVSLFTITCTFSVIFNNMLSYFCQFWQKKKSLISVSSHRILDSISAFPIMHHFHWKTAPSWTYCGQTYCLFRFAFKTNFVQNHRPIPIAPFHRVPLLQRWTYVSSGAAKSPGSNYC